MDFQSIALPTELSHQIWGWEPLRVVQMCIYPIVKFIYPSDYFIPFSREQHNVVDSEGVPISLQS